MWWLVKTMKVSTTEAGSVLMDYRKWRTEHGDPKRK